MTEKDVTKYTSVTTLTGLLPKNLVWWAGNAVAKCAFYEKDWHDLPTKEDKYEHVRRAHERIKSKAANLGSEIHNYIEAKNLDKPPPPYKLEARPRMRQFESFMEVVGPRIEAAETKVYHREPPGFEYAGTMDVLCEIDGEMAVLDVKTGKNVYAEAALQINAYAHCDFLVADPKHPGARQITLGNGKRWYEWHGPATDELPIPEVKVGYVLHLADDKWALHRCDINDELQGIFLGLFEIDSWERHWKKKVFEVVEEVAA